MAAGVTAVTDAGPIIGGRYLLELLAEEIASQDAKHGPFAGSPLGRSRLALACLEDETAEALEAWRRERFAPSWELTRGELLQVAAVSLRAIRDAFADDQAGHVAGDSNHV